MTIPELIMNIGKEGVMIRFDKVNNRSENFSISIQGDKHDYIETIKAILSVLSKMPEESYVSQEVYYMCNLIESLLPDERQIVNLDEAEYLQAIKEQNNIVVSAIVDKSNTNS